MGGDYNAKHTAWGSRVIDPRGRQLLRAAQMSDCTFISGGEPTYWPTDSRKIPDILDLFIWKIVSSNYAVAQNIYDLSSDHSPMTYSEYMRDI